MSEETERDVLRVLALQGEVASNELTRAGMIGKATSAAIDKAEGVLRRQGVSLPRHDAPIARGPLVAKARSWDEIVAEARAARPSDISFADILTPEELASVKARLDGWGAEFAALHKLEPYDYVVAGIAGVLAALADVFLVRVPAHPGFLGGVASEGGWLSNVMKDGFAKLLPEERIRTLEAAYPVSFDPSTSRNLAEKVAGLGPRSHRLQSLGHDPILGWVVGVRDAMTGQFTAIGKDGSVVIQSVAGFDPAEIGAGTLVRLIDALRSVGGHMASDIATPAGLPPPFAALLQFLQIGNIKGRSVAEIVQLMYREGYDFRHFLAGGVPVASIEAIVRIAWVVREMHEGKGLVDSLPTANKPRLRTGLFLAHSVAAAVNAGKVCVTQNPLSVSWAQWLAFFRYLLPQMHWMLVGREDERHAFVQGKLDEGWLEIEQAFAAEFKGAMIEPAVL